MGMTEAKKTAKDINNNTKECSDKLEAVLKQINTQIATMNTLLSDIKGTSE